MTALVWHDFEEGRMTKPQIVWLRRDLRMADNPALYSAAQQGPVVAVYVLDDEAAGDHKYGGASRWWLHHSLESLSKSFGARNSRIVLRRGDAVERRADQDACGHAGQEGPRIRQDAG